MSVSGFDVRCVAAGSSAHVAQSEAAGPEKIKQRILQKHMVQGRITIGILIINRYQKESLNSVRPNSKL
jgi:hypothetical protein